MSNHQCQVVRFKRSKGVVCVAVALILSACTTLPRPMLEPDVGPDALKPPTALDNDFVDVEAGFESGDMFMLRPLGDTGKLPDKSVAPFSLNEVGVYDTLRMLVADTGLALNIEGGTRGGENYGAVSMFDVHGKLQDVLDTLSESMGFFYSVRKNTLHIEPDRQFIVSLPPALSDDNMAGLTNTLQFLGAKETYIDRLNRSLVFRANRQTLTKVETYLNNVRQSRSMIIYAMNIFQVDLKHNSDTGIQWNQAGWATAPGATISTSSTTGAASSAGGAAGGTASGSAGATAGSVASAVGTKLAATGTGLGVGMVLSTAHFNIDMLVNFLKTQGTVKAISQPRIGVMNGTKGTLSVGQTLTYVSKVGTTYATSLNQITTETKDLKTGVDISVYGDVSDNTVYTHLDLKISDVVKINKYTAMGTDLTLPQTVNRDLNTVVRARPGDMILVGGITIDRDSREDDSGISKNGVSTEVSRSEMVLALKTKVINFLPKKKPDGQQAVANKNPGVDETKLEQVNNIEQAKSIKAPNAVDAAKTTEQAQSTEVSRIGDQQKKPVSVAVAPAKEKRASEAPTTPLSSEKKKAVAVAPGAAAAVNRAQVSSVPALVASKGN
jgi:hypothetical protein